MMLGFSSSEKISGVFPFFQVKRKNSVSFAGLSSMFPARVTSIPTPQKNSIVFLVSMFVFSLLKMAMSGMPVAIRTMAQPMEIAHIPLEISKVFSGRLSWISGKKVGVRILREMRKTALINKIPREQYVRNFFP